MKGRAPPAKCTWGVLYDLIKAVFAARIRRYDLLPLNGLTLSQEHTALTRLPVELRPQKPLITPGAQPLNFLEKKSNFVLFEGLATTSWPVGGYHVPRAGPSLFMDDCKFWRRF